MIEEINECACKVCGDYDIENYGIGICLRCERFEFEVKDYV